MEAPHLAVEPDSRMSLLRPAVSALAGVLVVACLARFGLSAEAVLAAAFVVVLGVLVVIDLEQRLLPDRIVLPSAAAMLAARVALDPDRMLEFVVAALGTAAFLLLAALVSRGGIAMGDVKLGLLLGAALGEDVVTALLLGTLAGGLVSAVILLRGGRAARKQTIAYGPFLAFGAVVALLAGDGFSATPF